ncbi:ARM repeat-containing protein [Coprinellus micaceus]|uniref:ARM repeat-containing protein n=1 Tax=Coprinellus micaceus TaxID=71717 RepID=A0A4Y7SH01_COPMI|nr:ARM repeat-containing protein [Coprinellus micaceus]
MALDDAWMSVSDLKRTKNRVIGNPVAKEALVRDGVFMRRLVDLLDCSSSLSVSSSTPSTFPPTPSTTTTTTITQDQPRLEARTEAAHIIGSLCHGSESALFTLLRLNTLPILVRSLASFTSSSSSSFSHTSTSFSSPPTSATSSSTTFPSTSIPGSAPITLKSAYARALRALVSSVADVVGPSEWGLRPEPGSEVREAARVGLEYVFSLETLDTLFPLLLPPPPPSSPSTHLTLLTTPLVSLLASATRSPAHRAALVRWLPPADRAVLERAGRSRKRGWEKVGVVPSPVSPVGGSASGFGSAGRATSPTIPAPGTAGGVSSTNTSAVPMATTVPTTANAVGATSLGGSFVLGALVALLGGAKDPKLQEAALLALAALARESGGVGVAGVLGRGVYPPPLALVHTLTKSRNVDVQLAACLCATHILRSLPPASSSSSSSSSSSYPSSSSSYLVSHSTTHRPFTEPAFPGYLTTPTPPAPSSSYAPSHHHHHHTHAGAGYGAAAANANANAWTTGSGGHGASTTHVHGGCGGGSANPFDYAQSGYAQSPLEDACVRAVVGVFTKVVGGVGGGGEKEVERRVRGCYVLYHLITDDRALCQFAFERGCLDVLAEAVKAITPVTSSSSSSSSSSSAMSSTHNRTVPSSTSRPVGASTSGSRGEGERERGKGRGGEEEGWDESEGEGVARVREACLTAIATLGLFNTKIRQAITDTHGLLPYITTALRQGVPASAFPPAPSSTAHKAKTTATGRIVASTSNVNTPIPTRANTPTPGSFSRRGGGLAMSSSLPSGSSSSPPVPSSGPSTSKELEQISKSSAGVRYAACQCVRVLSRGVSVLRTNIVDSGLGMEVFRVVMRGWKGPSEVGSEYGLREEDEDREEDLDDMYADEEFDLDGDGAEQVGVGDGEGGERGREGEEVEDRRVLNAALAAICNIVMEFSPLRPTFLQQGLMPRLVQLVGSPDPSLRLNALWAIKNLLYRTSLESKRSMMRCLGWGRLFDLIHDPDLAIQEQAYGVIRNISSDEEGLEMIFRRMGQDALLDSISEAISVDAVMPSSPASPSSSPSPSRVGLPRSPSISRSGAPRSPSIPRAGLPSSPSISRMSSAQPLPPAPSLHDRTPTIIQALYALANLCNGSSTLASAILAKPTLLANLRGCLAECGGDVRKPAVDCLLKLAREHPKKRRALVESGVIGTLRRLCEWVPPSHPSSSSAPGPSTPSSVPGAGAVYPHAYHHPGYGPMWSAPPTSPGTPANMNPGVSSTGRPSAVPMARRASGGTSPVRSLSYGSATTYTPPPPVGMSAIPPQGYQAMNAYQRDTAAYMAVIGGGSGYGSSSGANAGSSVGVVGSGSGGAMPIHPAFAGQVYPQHAAGLAGYAGYAYPHAGTHPHPSVAGIPGVPGRGFGGAGVIGGGVGVGMGVVGSHGGVGGGGGSAVSASMDMDKEVYDMARAALDWLEHGEGYGM